MITTLLALSISFVKYVAFLGNRAVYTSYILIFLLKYVAF